MKAVNFHSEQPGAPRNIGIPEILAAMRGMVDMFERGRNAADERAERAERAVAERMSTIEARIVAAERALTADVTAELRAELANVAERVDAARDAVNHVDTAETELRGQIARVIATAAADRSEAARRADDDRAGFADQISSVRAAIIEASATQTALQDIANRFDVADDAMARLDAERADFAARIDMSVNAVASLAEQLADIRAAITDAASRADTAERAISERVRAAVSAIEERMIVDATVDASGNLIISNSRGEMRTIFKTATENKDFELRNRAIKLKNEGKSLAAICKELGLTRYALGKLMK